MPASISRGSLCHYALCIVAYAVRRGVKCDNFRASLADPNSEPDEQRDRHAKRYDDRNTVTNELAHEDVYSYDDPFLFPHVQRYNDGIALRNRVWLDVSVGHAVNVTGVDVFPDADCFWVADGLRDGKPHRDTVALCISHLLANDVFPPDHVSIASSDTEYDPQPSGVLLAIYDASSHCQPVGLCDADSGCFTDSYWQWDGISFCDCIVVVVPHGLALTVTVVDAQLRLVAFLDANHVAVADVLTVYES